MLAEAAGKIRERHQYLSQLDSIAGDGDHGTTMLRVAECMEGALKHDSAENVGALLRDLGWSVMGVDGGASSALLGTFFSGMGEAVIGDTSVSCGELGNALESGLRAVQQQTRARPGDKTMLDALVPAVTAFRTAASLHKDLAQAMREAATAAQAGADSTKDFVARFGRAKFLGDKTLGSPDAGAVSIALLFSGFYAGVARERKS